MKHITITLGLVCADDVPSHVLEWMAGNLVQHAMTEFREDYDPKWCDGYDGPPLAGHVAATVSEVVAGADSDDVDRRVLGEWSAAQRRARDARA